jgi:hypothetical protein
VVRQQLRLGLGNFRKPDCENLRDAFIGDLRLMLQGQQTSAAVIAEPPLIPSSERFLTEPVK